MPDADPSPSRGGDASGWRDLDDAGRAFLAEALGDDAVRTGRHADEHGRDAPGHGTAAPPVGGEQEPVLVQRPAGGDLAFIQPLLDAVVATGASDLHLAPDLPPIVRVDGSLRPLAGVDPLPAPTVDHLVRTVLGADAARALDHGGDAEAAIDTASGIRFRIAAFYDAGRVAAAFRVLPATIPRAADLGLSGAITDLVERPHGLVLVTGPTGSGKTTTLAALVDHVNRTRNAHVITVEDPIEYRHRHLLSVVHQREVGADTPSFEAALRHALRQDPDVLVVGELRDTESMRIALQAADTGHLVLGTVHTLDAPGTVHRLVDSFAADQQPQVRSQLAAALNGIVSQRLLRSSTGTGRVLVTEVLIANQAVRTLIRDGKIHQIHAAMENSGATGARTMARSIDELLVRGLVDRAEAELLRRT
ncbi:MAG: PilT/PilU family type 4a pilus ATPase [Actinomycetota bacterium]|nr:PilT/PilU family type 4a pilus ATPase [Actinomycetota bacterium]